MRVLRRGIRLAMGIMVLGLAGQAAAQENLDLGKTPAQLFASDCAVCHKTPQGLAAKGGVSGLEGFLREHYTASRESAAAIAGYLRAAGSPPAPAGRTTKRPPKGDDKAKTGDKKSGEKKLDAAKPGEVKPADAKASEPKSAEPKVEPKAEQKAEPKPAEPKAAEPKPAEGGKAD